MSPCHVMHGTLGVGAQTRLPTITCHRRGGACCSIGTGLVGLAGAEGDSAFLAVLIAILGGLRTTFTGLSHIVTLTVAIDRSTRKGH